MSNRAVRLCTATLRVLPPSDIEHFGGLAQILHEHHPPSSRDIEHPALDRLVIADIEHFDNLLVIFNTLQPSDKDFDIEHVAMSGVLSSVN